MAVGLMTWLDKVEMVPSVVIGVAREAFALATLPPARLVETVPVTVPRVVATPTEDDVTDGISMDRPELKWFRMLTITKSLQIARSFFLPVVPLTTRVVTVGLTADTDTGVTSRIPPTVLMGTVRRMVPGCPGAPFKTT